MKKIHGITLPFMGQLFDGEQLMTAFVLQSDSDRLNAHFFAHIRDDKNYLKNILKQQRTLGQKLLELSGSIIDLNLENKSQIQLFSLFKHLRASWWDFDIVNTLPWIYASEPIYKYIEQILANASLKKDVIETLIAPNKLSFGSEEELEIYKLALECKHQKLSPKQIETKLARIQKKYFWIPFGYDGPEIYTIKHYENAVAETVKNSVFEIEKKVEELGSYTANIKKSKANIFLQNKLSSEIRYLAKQLELLAILTDDRKKYTFPAHVALDKVFDQLALKLSVSKTVIKCFTYEELWDKRNNPKFLVRESSNRLKNGFCLIHEKGKTQIITDESDLKAWRNKLFSKNEVQMLKGSVAYTSSKPVIRAGFVSCALQGIRINS